MKIYFLFTIFSFCFTNCHGQNKKDSAAIVLLLEKESATWRKGDIKAHADCWMVRPYSRVLISLGDSTVIDVPPAAMLNPAPATAGNGGYSVNTNYKMSIYANNAWVSHNEESVGKDGRRTYSYEIRMLEKVKGQWKLVGQSIHVYKP